MYVGKCLFKTDTCNCTARVFCLKRPVPKQASSHTLPVPNVATDFGT
ncbi:MULTISPECIES: hypothetical protein [unclassified Bartonella]